MYLPAHFQERRPEILLKLVRDHPLGTLIVHDGSQLEADHIPLLYRPATGGPGTLAGHVARANPLWRKAANGVDCLVVFQGPQHYISPGWYASKAETGRVVPTWNYEVVHVRGCLRAIEDPTWLRGLLDELTHAHEGSQPHPWKPSDAPADYLDRLQQSIVGIEIQITGMVGKSKLSQNQPASNQQSVIQALRSADEPSATAMADAIVSRLPPAPGASAHGT